MVFRPTVYIVHKHNAMYTYFIFIITLPVYFVSLSQLEEKMGRKFRLSVHRKYEEKRTTKLVVSIPLTVMTTVSVALERLPFRVSWPLSVFKHSLARCLGGLQQRLSAAGGLPTGNSFCYYGHDCAAASNVLNTIAIIFRLD